VSQFTDLGGRRIIAEGEAHRITRDNMDQQKDQGDYRPDHWGNQQNPFNQQSYET
jgi:hypothetical protein